MALANPQRGEAQLTVGGKHYVLKLSMNAAAQLEQNIGRTIGQVLAEAAALNFTSIRGLVWVLLQKHHAADFPTEVEVGNLIDEAGVDTFMEAVQAIGQANKSTAKAGTANPRRAQRVNGTGASTTSRPVATD